MVSWCDKLASTPTVGFGVEADFASSGSIIDAIAPILKKYVSNEKLNFSVDRHDTFNFIFSTSHGYQYIIEPMRIAVGFVHKVKTKQVSAGYPIVEMISEPAPYTELLLSACEKLVEATLMLPRATARRISRVESYLQRWST